MASQEIGSGSKTTFEDGTITVCVRARPLVTRELKQQSTHCLRFTDGRSVQIFEHGVDASNAGKEMLSPEEGTLRNNPRAFSFDHAYAPEVRQEVVYEDIGRPMLESSFKGFNTCVFAYGQTGSGKSFCMMGPEGGRQMDAAPGLIPRICENLFREVEEKKRTNALELQRARVEIAEMKDAGAGRDALKDYSDEHMPPELNIIVYVSYIEIYREKVRCLLHTDGNSENLKVRQHPSLGVYVEGLKEVPVSHTKQIIELMRVGNRNRHTAATGMNDVSSRSHAIFALQLIQMRKSATKDGVNTTTELRAKINLVDLAGSERVKSTGAEGETLKEGAQINKSLSTLGLVISTLAENSRKNQSKHVPYRDSTLTFLLRESLGGNSKTFMLSTVSPATANYGETLSTLRYADRAKSIVTRAFINETASDKRIRELEDEVTRLREKIRILQERDLSNTPAGAQVTQSPTISTLDGPERAELYRARRDAAALTNDTSLDRRAYLDNNDAILGEGKVANWTRSVGEGSGRSLLSLSMGKDAVSEAAGGARSISPESYSNSRESQEVDVLKSELQKMEEIMKQLTATNAEREQEVAAVLEAYKAQSTVRINRNDPYLLNLDGVGEWVVAHLVGSEIFLGDYSRHGLPIKEGCEPSDGVELPDASSRRDGVAAAATSPLLESQPGKAPPRRQYVVLSAGDYAEAVGAAPPMLGAPHCVLCAQPGGTFLLRPCPPYETLVNGFPLLLPAPPTGASDDNMNLDHNGNKVDCNDNKVDHNDNKVDHNGNNLDNAAGGGRAVMLQSGDVLALGAAGPQLKFVDPAVPPMTARGRRPLYQQPTGAFVETAAGSGGGGGPSGSGVNGGSLGSPLARSLRGRPRPVLNAQPSANSRRGRYTDPQRASNLYQSSDSEASPTTPEAPVDLGTANRPVVPALQLGGLAKPNVPVPALQLGRLVKPSDRFPMGGADSTGSPSLKPDSPFAVAPPRQVDLGRPRPHAHVGKEGVVGSSESPFLRRVLEGRVVPRYLGNRASSAGVASRGKVLKGKPLVVQGTVPSARSPPPRCEPDSERFIGRHNFVFLGPVQGGKTALQENLKLPSRWYSFLVKDRSRVRATWGFRRSHLTIEGSEDMELLFTELSGLACFSVLQDHLPTRRVTYMLCFSLTNGKPSLQMFNQILEFILCNSDHRDASVVLVATHLDKCKYSDQELYNILEGMGQQVHNFFQLLQPNSELRPTIVARFAVDNVNQKVFSAGFSKMRNISDLLIWMSDHALHRCKNDIDFLNGRVPLRCEKLRMMTVNLRTVSNKWCISLSDYKSRAKALDPRYGQKNDLHVHTQLLGHAGILQHRFRHTRMRKFVIVDVDWYLKLLACIACCGPISEGDPDLMVLCASGLMGRFQDTGLLPFSWTDVIAADQYCLLSKGIITIKVFHTLISGLLREKGVERSTLSGILDLLRYCDYIITGSRLRFSPSLDSLAIGEEEEGPVRGGGSGEEKGDADSDLLDPTPESFFLLPANFFHHASQAVVEYLPRLLTGPFYRFTFNMVPLHFFAKVTCRLADVTARGVYIGPVQQRQVEAEAPYMPFYDSHDPNDDDNIDSFQKGFVLPPEKRVIPVIPGEHHFWQEAVWALGPAGNRAFIRIVHHSLFISFYSTTELFGRETPSNGSDAAAEFFDSLLSVVREVVRESPGAQCQEGLLCSTEHFDQATWPFISNGNLERDTTSTDLDHILHLSGEAFSGQTLSCYYCTVDENINSFDKIREVEQYALQTARYRHSRRAVRTSCAGSKEDGTDKSDAEMDVVPLLRNFTAAINIEALLNSLESDVGSPGKPKLKETLQQALVEWNRLHLEGSRATLRRNSDTNAITKCRDKLGDTIDVVVDTLAQWRGHTIESNSSA